MSENKMDGWDFGALCSVFEIECDHDFSYYNGEWYECVKCGEQIDDWDAQGCGYEDWDNDERGGESRGIK